MINLHKLYFSLDNNSSVSTIMAKESHFEKNDSKSAILSVSDNNNELEFISALFTFEKTSLQTLMMDEESCHNKIFVNSQETDDEEEIVIEDDEETFDYNLSEISLAVNDKDEQDKEEAAKHAAIAKAVNINFTKKLYVQRPQSKEYIF